MNSSGIRSSGCELFGRAGSACKPRNWKRRRGATIVLMCLLIPAALAIASFCINVVYLEFVRTELQITTDVATRAAGRVLAVTGSRPSANAAAKQLLELNPTANKVLTLNDVNIGFGVSTRYAASQRYQFNAGKNVNSVFVDSKGSFQVPMLFPTLGVSVPFRPAKTAISTQIEMDLAIVLDRSGSMAFASYEESVEDKPPLSAPVGWGFGSPVPPESRWLDAVASIDRLVELLKVSSHNEAVSLCTFDDKGKVVVDLTSNYEEIRAALADNAQEFKGGDTNLADGILEGAESLADKKTARPWSARVLIVLSDGIHNDKDSPLDVAQKVRAEHISIFTVSFSSEADQQLMARIAKEGGGEHYHAETQDQLVHAFEDIARSLPTLITF